MPLWMIVKRWAYTHLSELSGRNLLVVLVSYVVISWSLLSWCGEEALTENLTDFIYYLIVTSSTVGYGDMSPATAMGKWVVGLFVIPGGLALFAVSLSRTAAVLINSWRAGVQGKRRVKVDNHILLLGWNEQRTLHLIRMLQHEESGRRPIVLCARAEIENPLPSEIEFVHVSSFTDGIAMNRTNIEQASCIIVDNPEDDITLSAALYCANRNPNAHLLAYFKDESLSQLLKTHCNNAECIPSIATELLAKAAVDPGSSALHQELLSSTQGMTQYSVTYSSPKSTTVSVLFDQFKKEYHATLIGLDSGDGIELNPKLDTEVVKNTKLFYIADERVEHFDWEQ
ncbi:potassium channel protein [Vibrio genomosp. F10]|uniref:potassium channel protein n=1 Tax=Vibrio genomosp. F10 TaxID=723171 RepID=UPI000363AA56|nr:ion channel [Vibrio genomosp. F10]OEF05892.1 potassium channel protein [Vibrio genomosp. F10 str. 9ZB36]